METKYKTFIRSCKNWREFSKARKTTDSTGLSFEAARARCDWYNKKRTARQIKRGTLMEFTAE